MIRDWVELNMTPGIGPRAAAKLLERFGSAEAVYRATRAELEQLRLPPEAVDSIIARDLLPRAEAEIEAVRKLGGDILLLDDGVYPSSLREIYDPPIVLYVKGAWSECLDQPCIGIVGSRRCSTYGQNSAIMLARDLAQRVRAARSRRRSAGRRRHDRGRRGFPDRQRDERGPRRASYPRVLLRRRAIAQGPVCDGHPPRGPCGPRFHGERIGRSPGRVA